MTTTKRERAMVANKSGELRGRGTLPDANVHDARTPSPRERQTRSRSQRRHQRTVVVYRKHVGDMRV
jgi:hypothetical protein